MGAVIVGASELHPGVIIRPPLIDNISANSTRPNDKCPYREFLSSPRETRVQCPIRRMVNTKEKRKCDSLGATNNYNKDEDEVLENRDLSVTPVVFCE